VDDHDRRGGILALLEVLLGASGDEGRPAVISVDLDRFGEVNETRGRDAGDEFLDVVARRLRGAVREEDAVERTGGDEFLVVCPRVGTAAEAMRIAFRVAESLGHEIQLKRSRTRSRASIGVAWSTERDTDAATLLSRADAALRVSKERGAGRPVLFTPPPA